MSLNSTPSASRLHVVVLGACNSGKSSLVNLLTGQNVSLVSEVAGTTTDPVNKAMELPGAGPAVIIDTAGFDDATPLGAARVEMTLKALDRSDIAIILIGENPDVEAKWMARLKEKGVPVIKVVNKTDTGRVAGDDAIAVSARDAIGREALIEAVLRAIPADHDEPDLLRGLVGEGDTVVLVMPQDKQAPKGRLILPQVQTLRALLDRGCNTACTTPQQLGAMMKMLSKPPQLVITDSQVFRRVAQEIGDDVPLTSFSVLMAAYKGDIEYFVESARAIATLAPDARVLITEACTHAPQTEDIGRVKIPALLRQRISDTLRIDIVSGRDFPADLRPYSLIIHCGACMFNRRLVMSRVAAARAQHVAMTNYGITIAALTGILPRVVY